ncbi:DUF262 domain-containing protein [Vibrio coralliirubri]|uniref:DUF262 domain-containing protein n=1 Tax=Vibrio coralliirubri TaxID=1516159 RepID=UPI00228405F0|nr:DUF262 domain-containing protein [Vibrio coralliirubri]MCY9864992.1 DUF262 domain-containing protein [Vibrio coralliirubri]
MSELSKFDAFKHHTRNNAFSLQTYSVGTDLSDCLSLIARFCNREAYQPLRDVEPSSDKQASKALSDIIFGKIPPFQRNSDKWTAEMQTGFMHNILKGHKANPIALYSIGEHKNDCFILDGLQRMTAVSRFFVERDMEFPLPDGRLITSEEIFAEGDRHSFWGNTPFDIKVFHFESHLEAVDFYIEFNENITHSPADILRAKEFRKSLLEAN